MQWFNYLAETVSTPLSGPVIINANQLLDRIKKIPEKTSAYHCYYDLEERDTFVSYQGLMRPVFDMIHIDLDSEADLGESAWSDALRLCKKLIDENVQFHLFFSGNKGFHIAVPASAIGIKPGPKEILEAQVRCLLTKLKPDYQSVDLRIWNANRKFRAHGSMHEKTSLYKICLTGKGLKVSSLAISDIRELAKIRDTASLPILKADAVNPWLAGMIADAQAVPSRSAPSLKLIPAGAMLDDDAAIFAHFKGKKCTADMLVRAIPGFNRHDIAMRIIYDLYSTGTPEAKCEQIMSKWADKIFGSDSNRAADIPRLVRDAYHKPQTYTYGCFDDVKKAYCSAKCGLFGKISPEKRATPLNMTAKQRSEASGVSKQTEGELADAIISQMDEIITCEKDYFQWVGTHWKRLDRILFEKKVTDCAIAALENKAFSSGIRSLRDQVIMKLKVAPEKNNLNACSGEKFPFLDGTVHVVKGEKGQIQLELREHSREDYISHCKPFPFHGEHGLPRSGDFAHYVKTRRETMGDDGIVALKQLFGAALIPYAPRLFFLVGGSNTGKSTTAEILENLLGEENVSSVNPTEDNRFSWEPAIGKIANIKRELSLKKPLKDDLLKEIRDKRPISIDRKGIKGVKATLPFLHVYCCNTLPPSHEGNTGAWDNRLTVMSFKAGYVNGFAHIDNLGAFLWSQDPGGILDFAREGLELLSKAGFKYTVTEESREALEEWQEETDPVKAWLKAVLCGDCPAAIERKPETGALVGSSLYTSYKNWAAEFNGNGFSYSDRRFFRELARIGFSKARKTNTGVAFHYPKLENALSQCGGSDGTILGRRGDSPSRLVDNAPF